MLSLKENKKIEKAIFFLVKKSNQSIKNSKPVILHSLKVGINLCNNGYNKNIVIAGILHDILEDTETKIEEIKKEFGLEVAELVESNTFNEKIKDETERYKELFNRCLSVGKDALIIKAADILDNSNYYSLSKDKEKLIEKMNYFMSISKKLIGNEDIFQELQKQYKKIRN